MTFIKVRRSDICFLLWDKHRDLASTLVLTQTRHGYTVTADQLLPLSWKGRSVKSSIYDCCVLVSNQWALEELKGHRHMIAFAEYKFINLVLLSLQEFLFPTAQMTELPVWRCYITVRKQKSCCCVVIWYFNTRKEQQEVWKEACNNTDMFYKHFSMLDAYHLINFASISLITNLRREWKLKVTASCILFSTQCKAGDSLSPIILRCAQLAGRRQSSPWRMRACWVTHKKTFLVTMNGPCWIGSRMNSISYLALTCQFSPRC